ncbi:MAG: Tetratricopeptide repeat protein [Sphingobacteriaceae bacterium]|jgi:tetratricopeptide (TPR) repeat protein|nr:Tetratricopeptide repeat protein [Sphingobacteriaceae bacterium]
MSKLQAFLFLAFPSFLLYFNCYGTNYSRLAEVKIDSNRVIELNTLGYKARLTDPSQTIKYADQALEMAEDISFTNGVAEAYRIKGIGWYYKNQTGLAIQNYLTALQYFTQANNGTGIARVNNNIGVLYHDVDYDKALEYFQKSLELSERYGIQDLTSGLYLNIGTIYQKKGNYNTALNFFKKSYDSFNRLGIAVGSIQCLQNMSIVYKDLRQLDKAESYAIQAIQKAKENDLNITVAGTNLTLSKIYIIEGKYDQAEQAIKEGRAYSDLLKDEKLQYDFLYNAYTLEESRKNYHQALQYLKEVYKTDSTNYNNNVSTRIALLQEQSKRRAQQQENLLLKEKQKYSKILILSTIVGSALLVIVIVLLFRDVRKKALNNKQLTALNAEISSKKEDLDRINHNLEDIIDERTNDLRIKNKKLSDYSSHLSHQIRGPVATLKGLMNLEREGLIEKEEFVQQVEKCVNDIDDKILNINEMLHDPKQYGFRNAQQ